MPRWLPFRFTPASWGLIGNAYLEAEAYYTLEGEALDRRLLDIRYANDRSQWERESLLLDQRYHHLSDHEVARKQVELEHPEGLDRDLALLSVDREHGKIEENAYQKQRATMRNEPWIAIVNSGFDPAQGIDGVFFEFDWNQQWIEFLRSHGYSGHTPEQVVDEWFADVCRSQGMADPLAPFSIVQQPHET